MALSEKKASFMFAVLNSTTEPIKIDFDKLAALSGYKTKASANTAWCNFKKSLETNASDNIKQQVQTKGRQSKATGGPDNAQFKVTKAKAAGGGGGGRKKKTATPAVSDECKTPPTVSPKKEIKEVGSSPFEGDRCLTPPPSMRDPPPALKRVLDGGDSMEEESDVEDSQVQSFETENSVNGGGFAKFVVVL